MVFRKHITQLVSKGADSGATGSASLIAKYGKAIG